MASTLAVASRLGRRTEYILLLPGLFLLLLPGLLLLLLLLPGFLLLPSLLLFLLPGLLLFLLLLPGLLCVDVLLHVDQAEHLWQEEPLVLHLLCHLPGQAS